MKSLRLVSFLLFACILLNGCGSDNPAREKIDLAGEWMFELDSLDKGEAEAWFGKLLSDQVTLPGTTDTNKKGIRNEKYDETTHLSREYYYKGKAWYQKTVSIPTGWTDKVILLTLERTKPTKVWIDGQYIGSSDDISVKQEYDLSRWLTPGEHTLTILVDNGESVPRQLLSSSHAYTESTQTNWNGIIGEISLQAFPETYIRDIWITPFAEAKAAHIKVKLNKQIPVNATLLLEAHSQNTSRTHKVTMRESMTSGSEEREILMALGGDALLWDEFDPVFYDLTISLEGEGIADKHTARFGLRDFKVEGTQFVMNGNTTFLRGKHDAAVFPLTAHVAMDVETWRHYFQVAKSYGINHYRFHSWCPPEACFEAADIEGIYLQPELPFWGSLREDDKRLLDFLTKEGVLIQQTYGNHPSFVMFALGNELSGSQEVMNTMIETFRGIDNRHIYATGSNNYLGFRGITTEDDYFTTCRVGPEKPFGFDTHARGSFSFADAYDGGLINHMYPNSVMNFDTAVQLCKVPIISHETGQFQIYPDYKETEKYTGVLQPRNFEVFRKRLIEAGMEKHAHDFFLASGKWSVLLYRADIEMDLRTAGFGGFQLLDLQDYPGQGSAYVGILDAFMDSKGLIEPEEWRQFCSEVVPLFTTEKFCYVNNETLKGDVLIANYSKEAFRENTLNWLLEDDMGNELDKGTLRMNIPQGVLANIGEIRPDISSVGKARQVNLTLEIPDTPYRNTYPLWVFPADQQKPEEAPVKVTRKMDKEAVDVLREGGKVLWFPDHEQYKDVTVGGLFQTDYWNFRMFKTISENGKKPVSPGTLGLLTNPEHPLFNDFPTDFHTNWQWFTMVKNSRPLILDPMPNDYLPIVQVIDNIERNHKLGMIFEMEVEGGKLLVCMSDLPSHTDKPEALQLYNSMVKYMLSDQFNPGWKMTVEELTALFNAKAESLDIAKLGNISY